LDLKATNADGFSPLDLAFMTGRAELVRLVLTHGGAEGPHVARPEAAMARLATLAHESKKQVRQSITNVYEFNEVIK